MDRKITALLLSSPESRDFLEAAERTVDAVRAIGQRYRDDWSDFDGRTLKAELIDATAELAAALRAAQGETP